MVATVVIASAFLFVFERKTTVPSKNDGAFWSEVQQSA